MAYHAVTVGYTSDESEQIAKPLLQIFQVQCMPSLEPIIYMHAACTPVNFTDQTQNLCLA